MTIRAQVGRSTLPADRLDQAEVRFKQIIVGQFTSDRGGGYSTLGLSEDGRVYRYDPHCEGWIPWPMKVASCRESHAGRR
jgi:hypothetical protein